MAEPFGDEMLMARAAARLSHDVKNALGGIAGALEVIGDWLPGTVDTRDVMTKLQREIGRIDRSVTELCAFANPASPVLERRDVHDVIDEALGGYVRRATTTVRRHYDHALPSVPLDARLFGEALRRVFINADDAMPQGGRITVATDRCQNALAIAVRDTGSGLEGSELERIFEPFYTTKQRGLGLGLAIARQLVAAHRGSIRASRCEAGEAPGAELIIRLPLEP